MRSLLRITLALTTGLLLLASMAPARAATTRVVDDDAMGVPGNCNAVTAAFTSIQAAVTASAPGDTVKVCPGTYTENVLVDKTIIVNGAKPGVDARTRGTANESVVHSANPSLPIFMLNANNVRLNGFLIERNSNNAGIQTTPAFSGYRILNNIVRDNVIGIYLHGSGAATTLVRQNLVRDNNRPGSSGGNGIYSDQGALGIVVAANRFLNHDNAGVLFATAGTEQKSIIIKDNRSINDNTFVALFNVQNAHILANLTNDTNNADDFGSAIFVGGDADGILIERNTLRNPGFSGIAIRDTLQIFTGAANVDVLRNTVTGAEGSGIDVTASEFAAVSARSNVLRNNGIDGIVFGSATNGNQIRDNTARFNAEHDCHDDSSGAGTAGTANTWNNNIGVTDTPNVCRRDN